MDIIPRAAAFSTATALLVALLTATGVQANNISDYNDGADIAMDAGVNPTTRVYDSADDWCSAVDNDGPAGNAPVGDDNLCDNNDTDTVSNINGPGDPTGLVGLFFPNCVDTPDRTDCDNGTFGIADSASGDGRFGGDYPNATEVVISVASGQVRVVVQVGYRNVVGAGTSNPTVFTGIGTAFCIGAGVTYTVRVGGGGTQIATDPPANKTIVSYFIGRVLTVGTCGGTPGGNTPKTIIGAWTYLTQVNDSTVNANVTVTPDAGGLTCTITFDNDAAVYDGRWGAVGSSIMIGPSNQYGNFQSDGPRHGASGAWAGTVLVPAVHGQTVNYVVWAWAIGAKYIVAFGAIPCNNPPAVLNEPACVIVVASGTTTGPACIVGPSGAFFCGPAGFAQGVPFGWSGFDCVSYFACEPKAVNALAVGLGAATARVWCDHDADFTVDAGETKAFASAPLFGPVLLDLGTGPKDYLHYHCTFAWAPGFTGSLACFDP